MHKVFIAKYFVQAEVLLHRNTKGEPQMEPLEVRLQQKSSEETLGEESAELKVPVYWSIYIPLHPRSSQCLPMKADMKSQTYEGKA